LQQRNRPVSCTFGKYPERKREEGGDKTKAPNRKPNGRAEAGPFDPNGNKPFGNVFAFHLLGMANNFACRFYLVTHQKFLSVWTGIFWVRAVWVWL